MSTLAHVLSLRLSTTKWFSLNDVAVAPGPPTDTLLQEGTLCYRRWRLYKFFQQHQLRTVLRPFGDRQERQASTHPRTNLFFSTIAFFVMRIAHCVSDMRTKKPASSFEPLSFTDLVG